MVQNYVRTTLDSVADATRTHISKLSPRARLIAIAAIALLAIAVVIFVLERPSTTQVEPKAAASTGIVLSPEQRASAGVKIVSVAPISLAETFRAPGSVQTNEYTSGTVAPRMTATVIARTAKLGDRVSAGQPLVTLYSAEMAEAQSAFLLATRDLARFQKLQNVVAARELDQATTKRQEAVGRLVSYGMSPGQISYLAQHGTASFTMGQFQLYAPKSGTITRDAFTVGQVVEAGKPLFEIADQRDVWVEAFVSPPIARLVDPGRAVVVAGTETRPAKVVQVRETIDEETRTIGVRLQVPNGDGVFKPGQFVDVELFSRPQSVIAIPTEAVLRNEDGSWSVYAENNDGSFSARRVTALFVSGNKTAISGVAPGTRLVISGAFFVKSEGDKDSFGDE